MTTIDFNDASDVFIDSSIVVSIKTDIMYQCLGKQVEDINNEQQ